MAETDNVTKLRTRTNAENKEKHPMAIVPATIATPSTAPFIDAISFRDNNIAKMVTLKEPISLEFDHTRIEGRIDLKRYKISKDDYVDDTDIDLPLLCVLYSIIENELNRGLKNGLLVRNDKVTKTWVYLPELLRQMGYSDHFNQIRIENIINKMYQFENVVGTIFVNDQFGSHYQPYRVLTTFGYNPETNTIVFGSSYFEMIAYYIQKKLIRNYEEKHGVKLLDSNDQLLDGKKLPFLKPGHSRLLKMSAYNPRQERYPFEMASIICRLIDQAGSDPGTVPHIKAKTLMEMCPGFLESLAKMDLMQNRKNRIS